MFRKFQWPAQCSMQQRHLVEAAVAEAGVVEMAEEVLEVGWEVVQVAAGTAGGPAVGVGSAVGTAAAGTEAGRAEGLEGAEAEVGSAGLGVGLARHTT
jgi:hypothetical protein